jgi:hypothetical protein
LFATLFQEAEFQEAEFQEALFQEAEFQLAEFQLAEFQLALFQDALFHEAEFQEALFCAACIQFAPSKTRRPLPFGSGTRNWLRARFGLGVSFSSNAFWRLTSPTPTEFNAALPSGTAEPISTPLT